MFSRINSRSDLWVKCTNRENIILFLVFLFPLAGAFVRHWISDLFALLFLLSLFLFRKGYKNKFKKEEILFLSGFFAYFAIFIITSLVNGWGEEQTVWLLLELRFLAVIPIYIMLRNVRHVGQALLWGIIFGLILTFAWSIFELYIMDSESYTKLAAELNPEKRRLNGVYSVLFIGPYILLLSAFVIPGSKLLPILEKYKWLIILLLLAGFFMVAKSGARNAYLGLLVVSVVTSFYYYNSRRIIISSLVVLILCLGAWNFSDTVRTRINVGINQFENYMSEEDHVSLKHSGGSIGKRLELWRAAGILFKDNPIFGIGRGNFNVELRKLVDKGLINPAVKEYSQPHNVFLEVAVSRGTLGLIVLLWVLYYPLYFFIKTRQPSPHTALFGILHILVITVISLTEAATFIKGNFVATYLIFLSVFYLWHVENLYSKNNYGELAS